jgi:hypothetical protein
MRFNKHVRADELERAEAQIERIDEHIRSARIRLQALRLIWRGPCQDHRPRLG